MLRVGALSRPCLPPQVTHPALPDPDASTEGVPPGYQCVSLIEALNGPMSVAPSAPPVPITLSSADKPGEKRARKSRSTNKRNKSAGGGSGSRNGQGTSLEAAASAASARDDEEEEAAAAAESTEMTDMNPVPVIKYVNEVAAVAAPSTPSRKSAKESSAGVDDEDEASRRGSVDVVEQELAKMTTTGDEGEASTETARPTTTRVSLPGTPTSVASAKSASQQDTSSTASSSSSTKQLLPKSAGSAVIVKVHPTKPDATAALEEEEDFDVEDNSAEC